MALNFPDSPTLNQVYTDTTSGFSYQWDGVVWQSYTPFATKNITVLDDISGSFNSSTTIFNLTNSGTAVTPANSQQLRVTLGGILQEPGTDYLVAASTIIFTTAPDFGIDCSIVSLGPAVPVNTIIDGTVTPAKLSTGGPYWNTDGDVYISGITTIADVVKVGVGTTALIVEGDARITGILTVGSSSITLDGPNDTITVQTLNATNITGTVTGDATGLTGTPDIDVRNITGVAATFTGNVSIAGTLTYEDVTNVDSVGLITARSGVDVTGGSVVVGSAVTITSGGVLAGVVTATSFVIGAGSTSAPSLSPTGDSNTGIFFPSADTIAFGEGGSEAARFDSSGRLLLGTSSTSVGSIRAVFQGNSSGVADEPSVVIHAANTSTPTGGLGIFRFSDNSHAYAAEIGCYRDGGTWSGSSKPTRLTFSTTANGASSPTERMRISSLGDARVFSSNTNGFRVGSTYAAGINENLFVGYYSGSGTTSLGTECFVVRTNGNVLNTNNSYGSLSDAKLKENIVDANPQWDDIKALRPVNYNFKPETGHETFTQLGLIAQEVELVSPGLVTESPDRDEEGNDLGTVTKSVNYSVLYMKAVKALQEAMERIETLEARVAALETP